MQDSQLQNGNGIRSPKEPNESPARQATRYQLIYSIAALLVALACIYLGVTSLVEVGKLGATTWTLNLPGSKSEVSSATPGVILVLVGFLIILFTRFSTPRKVKK